MARGGRLCIGYQGWWMLSRVRGLGRRWIPQVVVVRCRGVAELAEHDVQGAGHPRMCWVPIVARPGS